MRALRLSVISLVATIATACTQPYLPSVDRPSTPTSDDLDIIAYIDKRLTEEYYWLDEVEEKSADFNRRLQWEEYLDNSLQRLTTNGDDGHISSSGKRVLYSYIRETQSTTRGATTGFGIALHYTIVKTSKDNDYYGFVVEDVYDGSPAEAHDIRRGDVIVRIDGDNITPSNYLALFNAIEHNTRSSLSLTLMRQTDSSDYSVELTKGDYEATPVAHHEILDIEGYDRKVGYLAYTGFESDYDDELIAALATLAGEGAQEIILDLRTNGGGSVLSAIKLASSLLGPTYNDALFCTVARNPRNTSSELLSEFRLEDTGVALGIEQLTIICSKYSASASEIIIEGMRGLDIPVTLVGTTTEGKNCGMDVTRRYVGSIYVEYAPITFMCFNAKGFGAWGDGITPDIDLSEDNALGIKDASYPIPRADWGDATHDVGLAAAIATLTGSNATTTTRTEDGFGGSVGSSLNGSLDGDHPTAFDAISPTADIARPAKGSLLYRE